MLDGQRGCASFFDFQLRKREGHQPGGAEGEAEGSGRASPESQELPDRDQLQPVCPRPPCKGSGDNPEDPGGEVSGVYQGMGREHEEADRAPVQYVRDEERPV